MKKGFTILELLAVLVVISIVVSFIQIAGSSWMYQSKLEIAAKEIESLLNLAVAQSLRTGKTMELVYDTEQQQFYFHESTSTTTRTLFPSTDTATDPLALPEENISTETQSMDVEESLRTRTLPDGISFRDIQTGSTKWEDPGQIRITISPYGITSDHIVHLKDEQGREFSIEFNAITSTVTFYEGYKEYELEESVSTLPQ